MHARKTLIIAGHKGSVDRGNVMAMDPLLPFETETDLKSSMSSMEERLRRIGEAISDLSRLYEVQRDHARRLSELETTVNRLHGIVMDLKQAPPVRPHGSERLDLLEAAVQRITEVTNEQKSLVEGHLSEQHRLLEELRRELAKGIRQEEEPAIMEIEDLFRRKPR